MADAAGSSELDVVSSELDTVDKLMDRFPSLQAADAKLLLAMRGPTGVVVKNRKYHLRKYKQCFVAKDAVTWFVGALQLSREESVVAGQRLLDAGCIYHVAFDHHFKDGYLFFRFASSVVEAFPKSTKVVNQQDVRIIQKQISSPDLDAKGGRSSRKVSSKEKRRAWRSQSGTLGAGGSSRGSLGALSRGKIPGVVSEEVEEMGDVDDNPLPAQFRGPDGAFPLFELIGRMKAGDTAGGLVVKDRRYLMRKFKMCFLGSDAVTWIMGELKLPSRLQATAIGLEMNRRQWLRHVTNDHPFQDADLFFQFTGAEEFQGTPTPGSPSSRGTPTPVSPSSRGTPTPVSPSSPAPASMAGSSDKTYTPPLSLAQAPAQAGQRDYGPLTYGRMPTDNESKGALDWIQEQKVVIDTPEQALAEMRVESLADLLRLEDAELKQLGIRRIGDRARIKAAREEAAHAVESPSPSSRLVPSLSLDSESHYSSSLLDSSSHYSSMSGSLGSDGTYGVMPLSSAAEAKSDFLQRTDVSLLSSSRTVSQAVDQWTIFEDDIEIRDEIARGAFGRVLNGIWRETPVAVKQLLPSTENARSASEHARFEFEVEVDILKHLRPHVNVVSMFGVATISDSLSLVLELVELGSLWNCLLVTKKVRKDPETASEVDKEITAALSKICARRLQILLGIARGIVHLHAEGVVHRDIAARNILLTRDLTPKLADLGLCRILKNDSIFTDDAKESAEEGNQTRSEFGPLKWLSPESLSDRIYSRASDIWALGATIVEILTADVPYGTQSSLEVCSKVAMNRLRPSTCLERLGDDVVTPDIFRLVQSTSSFEPHHRPTIREINRVLSELAHA